MKISNTKSLLSYAWGHFRRGYGMGTSFLLGIFNALNIVLIGLKVFIPSFSLITLILIYIFGFATIVIVSIGFDFLLLWLEFTQKEYLLGAKDSPSASIPIGSKEILNYQSTIAAINREIHNYQVQIQICKALHLDSQVPTLKSNIQSAEEYKEKMTDMLNKAVK